MTRVTVGIPVRNGGDYLRLAVCSVLAQSFRDWELLVVDDGSTDGSTNFLKAITDERVRLISDGRSRGLANRLNEICRLARGEYVARMDADDVMHRERLERQVSFLDRRGDVDVLGTAAYTIDAANRLRGLRSTAISAAPGDLLRSNPFIHPSVMGRVEWFRVWPYDARYNRAEDFELWSRAGAEGLTTLDEALLFYREVSGIQFRKYLETSRTVRRVILERGPALMGVAETGRAIVSSVVKDATYGLAHVCGLEAQLLTRRSRPLSASEGQEAENELSWLLGECRRYGLA